MLKYIREGEFNIISYMLCAIAVALGIVLLFISESFVNLNSVWSWVIIAAFLFSLNSVFFFNFKILYYVLDIGFAVLFFLGAVLCNTEFIIIGAVFVGLALISVLFKGWGE